MSNESSKTVLITGASRGIGLACAEECLRDNWRVIGVARSFEKCDLEHDLFTSIELDLSNTDKLSKELKQSDIPFNDLDAIIFNAGQGLFGKLEQLSDQKIKELIEINFLSHVYLSKLALPEMKRKKAGELVFIGSEAALRGGQQGSIYCARKFALRGFALSLREECANTGIRVSLIHPGMVRTNFFSDQNFQPGSDSEHAIEAEDVAKTVKLILDARPGTVFDEITLSPQKHVIDFS